MVKPLHEVTNRDFDTPRYRRAVQFARTIETIMRDFIPQDQLIRRHIHDQLLRMGWEGNVQIINVPEALDALNQLQLERYMVESHPLFVPFPGPLQTDG